MSDVLSRESIVLGGQARDRDAAITEAGELLVASGAVDAAYIEAMHERETSVSTFMGDWKGSPATYVVGIAGAGDDHLVVLQALAGAFTDDASIAALDAAQTPDDVLAVLGDVSA